MNFGNTFYIFKILPSRLYTLLKKIMKHIVLKDIFHIYRNTIKYLLLFAFIGAIFIKCEIESSNSDGSNSTLYNLKYTVTRWGKKGQSVNQFNNLFHIHSSNNENIYIVDMRNSKIKEYTHNGKVLNVWGNRGKEIGLLDGPFDIALDNNDQMYISERYINRIQVFSLSGKHLKAFGPKLKCKGNGTLKLKSITAISISQEGILYVIHKSGKEMIKINNNGLVIDKYEFSKGKLKDVKCAGNIACDRFGYVYVPDPISRNVYKINIDGNIVKKIDISMGKYKMCYPVDVIIDTDNNKYVCDLSNMRIVKYNHDDNIEFEWSIPGSIFWNKILNEFNRFVQPTVDRRIAVDIKGRIYYANPDYNGDKPGYITVFDFQ